MNKTFFLFFILFSIKSSFAQSGVNIIDHLITSPPNIFTLQPTQKSDKVFREKNNDNTTINGEEVIIRTYSIIKIHSTMVVTCYYFKENDGWRCKMAKFFSCYQATPNGIGYLGPNTSGTCITLLNLTSDGGNLNEFHKIQDIVMTGNPPWIAFLDQTKEFLYVSKLNQSEMSNPVSGITRAINFMNARSSGLQNSIATPHSTDSKSFNIDNL